MHRIDIMLCISTPFIYTKEYTGRNRESTRTIWTSRCQRDWEIVEALAADGVGLEDFDPAHVQRVQETIMITDEQYQELMAEGRIKPEDLAKERAKKKRKPT